MNILYQFEEYIQRNFCYVGWAYYKIVCSTAEKCVECSKSSLGLMILFTPASTYLLVFLRYLTNFLRKFFKRNKNSFEHTLSLVAVTFIWYLKNVYIFCIWNFEDICLYVYTQCILNIYYICLYDVPSSKTKMLIMASRARQTQNDDLRTSSLPWNCEFQSFKGLWLYQDTLRIWQGALFLNI